MAPKHAAEVAFSVVGVYLVASGIASSPFSVEMALHSPSSDLRWVGALGLVLTVVAGVGLILLRRTFATLAPPVSETRALPDAAPGAQAGAISVVGIYFLAHGVSNVLGAAVALLGQEPLPGRRGTLVAQVAEIAIGLALFLGARGVVGLWQRLRVAGRAGEP